MVGHFAAPIVRQTNPVKRREILAGHGPYQLPSSREYTALAARMAQHSPAEFAFSIISFHEQVIGAHALVTRAKTPRDITRGYNLLAEILQGITAAPVLLYHAQATSTFVNLQSQRIRVPTMDLRIAAIALSRNLVVLSRNISDFNKVPGLVTEDWTR